MKALPYAPLAPLASLAAVFAAMGCRASADAHSGVVFAPVASPSSSVAAPSPEPSSNGETRPPLVLADHLLPFGCAGVSEARHLAVCVVGAMGGRDSDTQVSLAFASLGGRQDSPPAIELWNSSEGFGSTPEAISLSENARSAAQTALQGFATLKPSAMIDWADAAPHRFHDTDLLLTKRQTSPGGENEAPQYDVTLMLRDSGRSIPIDRVNQQPVAGYVVQVYALANGLLIDRTVTESDEGFHLRDGRAWYCAAGACRPVR